MRAAFHGSVFYHLPAQQLLPMGALSPRRRRCSVALQRDFRVLAAAFFDGVILWHRSTIRFASRRIFLPTFSGATEKVGRRRHSCGVTANSAPPVPTGMSGRLYPQGVCRITALRYGRRPDRPAGRSRPRPRHPRRWPAGRISSADPEAPKPARRSMRPSRAAGWPPE